MQASSGVRNDVQHFWHVCEKDSGDLSATGQESHDVFCSAGVARPLEVMWMISFHHDLSSKMLLLVMPGVSS